MRPLRWLKRRGDVGVCAAAALGMALAFATVAAMAAALNAVFDALWRLAAEGSP